MRRWQYWVLVTIFWAGILPAIAQSAATTGGKSLLWRISGNGITQPSYLFGAIDYICPGEYFWTTAMQAAFTACNEVCLEVDMDPATINQDRTKWLINQEGKTLEYYFKSSEYEMVKQYARDSMSVDFDKVQWYKPLALQPLIVKKLLGCAEPVSYSKKILEMARKDGKKLTGLEAVSEEMERLDKVKFNEKVAATLAEMASGSNYFRVFRANLEIAYKEQDLARINTIFRLNKLMNASEINTLIDATSNEMASRMAPKMAANSVFFAVNVINLPGDKGLINQLRKAGYVVEEVK